jgi:hypothetical protein
MNIFCCLFIMYNLLKAKSYIKLIVQKLNYTWVEIIQYWGLGIGDWGLWPHPNPHPKNHPN